VLKVGRGTANRNHSDDAEDINYSGDTNITIQTGTRTEHHGRNSDDQLYVASVMAFSTSIAILCADGGTPQKGGSTICVCEFFI